MPPWAAPRSPTRSSTRRWRRPSRRSPPAWSRSPSVSDANVELIESPAALAALFAELAAEPLLAIDTEAASFHRFRDMVYLLQISSRSRTAVVDPLVVRDLS